jgi:uroporphyrinogen decarboxylase
MTKLLDTFNLKNTQTPIWFMRQAGRYLPEYMEIRKNTSNFLEFCYDSDKASVVTLQPITRFGFDAAIIFSDILVLPHTLGWNIEFKEKEGPILQQFTSKNDFRFLKEKPDDKINNIYDTVSKVKAKLPSDTSLIGFSGSPWTVVSYMLEGKGKQDFSVSKSFLYKDPDTTKDLISYITDQTIKYLLGQVNAGADVIQLFDSWAGVLSGSEYEDYVIKPTKKIIFELKKKHPVLPVIGFPRGSGFLYEKYITETGIDGIGVDQFVPIEMMMKWQDKITVQGNIDPVILFSNKETIKLKVNQILSKMSNKRFIFNLGHGILPSTPVENVEYLVKYVREYKT